MKACPMMLLKTNIEKMSVYGLSHYIYENKRLILFNP